MICFPNAKINIGLNILEKRADGYHNIETLFYPISLHDILEIIPAKDISSDYQWSSTGIKIDALPEQNLCIKALLLLKQHYSIPPVKIHLHKVIPFEAGLGGGSADAAFTLTMLNEIFELKISQNDLIKYAAQLGADCAFFIHNRPCLASGIGDILKPTRFNLSNYHLLLIKPKDRVSTAQAYSGVNPHHPIVPLETALKTSLKEFKNSVFNNFEDSVFPQFPNIKKIKDKLYQNHAIYAAMTGSGAAVFALFESKPTIEFDDCFVWEEKLK